MQDSILIWKFLSREFPDDHAVIFLYVCGNVRSPQTSIDQIMKITIKIFCPPLEEYYVKQIVKSYLDMKKRQYLNGQIKVKSIY